MPEMECAWCHAKFNHLDAVLDHNIVCKARIDWAKAETEMLHGGAR
jgi:hypothetical protein